MNLNKVFLLGRLTRDPDLRVSPSGKTIVNLGLATNIIRQDKDGNKVKKTEFHNIVLFGRLGEIASQYLKKGNLCLVVGRIQTRSWVGQDGQQRQRVEIIAEELQLGPKSQASSEKIIKQDEQDTEEVVYEEEIEQEREEKKDKTDEEDKINVEDIPF